MYYEFTARNKITEVRNFSFAHFAAKAIKATNFYSFKLWNSFIFGINSATHSTIFFDFKLNRIKCVHKYSDFEHFISYNWHFSRILLLLDIILWRYILNVTHEMTKHIVVKWLSYLIVILIHAIQICNLYIQRVPFNRSKKKTLSWSNFCIIHMNNLLFHIFLGIT